mmetsp:Transcript_10845/g.19037  ORF Transcript_10845/g.19037 Transcript_10845/m.19037 type:complete len:90 (-) Transcript_10845:64-333(-)
MTGTSFWSRPCGECIESCSGGVCYYQTTTVQWGSNMLCSAPTTTTSASTTTTTSTANLRLGVASSAQPSAANLCFGATLLAAFAAAFGA